MTCIDSNNLLNTNKSQFVKNNSKQNLNKNSIESNVDIVDINAKRLSMLDDIIKSSNIKNTSYDGKKIIKNVLDKIEHPSKPCHSNAHSKAGCGGGGCGYSKTHSNTCGK